MVKGVCFLARVIPETDFMFLQGTRSALYANNRESITVTVQDVTPKLVGALIALYERAVGIYAALININAYHQPGNYIFLMVSHGLLDQKLRIKCSSVKSYVLHQAVHPK